MLHSLQAVPRLEARMDALGEVIDDMQLRLAQAQLPGQLPRLHQELDCNGSGGGGGTRRSGRAPKPAA